LAPARAGRWRRSGLALREVVNIGDGRRSVAGGGGQGRVVPSSGLMGERSKSHLIMVRTKTVGSWSSSASLTAFRAWSEMGSVGAKGVFCAVVLLACATRTTHAGGDNRPGDRFFFGLAGGVTGDASAAGALDTSYWPSDYVGMTFGASFAGTNASGATPSSADTDLGSSVVLAVPLRYVQPYGGLWAGFARAVLNGKGTGLNLDYEPVLGMNAYLSRNLRAYVQWRPIVIHAGDPTMDASANVLVVGVRWSPDLFHSARTVNKVDAVWGTIALSTLLFILINVGSG
jgi:hypothetical protein